MLTESPLSCYIKGQIKVFFHRIISASASSNLQSAGSEDMGKAYYAVATNNNNKKTRILKKTKTKALAIQVNAENS